MAVHDHGLEAIRKASLLVTPGDTTEYKIRTSSVNGMLTESYDYLSINYSTSTQEIYTFKSGGSGGTTVATLTINYTDSTKNNISTVEKT